MPDTFLSNSQIVSAYREKTPGSGTLAAEAAELLPSGIAHDSRYLKPYALYIEHAAGPHKWDVDGNRYVDYFGGHGALLLGHCDPEVTSAVNDAMAAGTQFGANHPREVAWAQQVIQMVPSAERVRFTSSGTEATLMALRLARAHTGRKKVIRFRTHFHGWHDHMTAGFASHFDGSATVGVLEPVAKHIVLASPQDLDDIRSILENDDDIAAVICEPTGASFGIVPMDAAFSSGLRELTARHGALLIFDEVVTGFRCSPGGAQQAYGVTPDLTTMAKILAGGLPGGAVAGRREILDHLDFDRSAEAGREKIDHPGTFNANPVSATAGLTALRIIEAGDACEKANASAAWLRERFNEVLAEENVAWAAYGTFSGVQLYMNPDRDPVTPGNIDPSLIPYEKLKKRNRQQVMKLRLAMAVNGVDLSNAPGRPAFGNPYPRRPRTDRRCVPGIAADAAPRRRALSRSDPAELRDTALGHRAYPFAEVLGLAQPVLDHEFVIGGLAYAVRKAGAHGRPGLDHAQRRVLRDFGCHCLSGGSDLGQWRQHVGQPPFDRLLALDPAAGVEHQTGPLLADQRRQGMGQAEPGMKPEPGEIGGEPRFRRRHPEIGNQRQAETATDRCPLDGADNGRSCPEQPDRLDVEMRCADFPSPFSDRLDELDPSEPKFAPAQNDLPAEHSTAQRSSGSPSMMSIASAICWIRA